jgi:hypothetical protein
MQMGSDHFIREKHPARGQAGAIWTVYSEAASTQAEQSNGECQVQLLWCTVVSGQIDLNTGGGAVRANPVEKANPCK